MWKLLWIKILIKMNIYEYYRYDLKMNNSNRMKLLIDSGTWNPTKEDMIYLDSIKFHYKESKKKKHTILQPIYYSWMN